MLLQEAIYQVHLPQFEGPFDLLLFFIERDELNIHDIPISKLTGDFLGYMRQADDMKIDVGAEFTVVAAQLMKIKAQMLLPRPKLDDKGNEIDPRAELVDRLLEYKRYRDASEKMEQQADARSCMVARPYVLQEQKVIQENTNPTDELYGLSLYQLLKVYARVLEGTKSRTQKPKHVIQRYPYTVEEVRRELLQNLDGDQKVDFVSLVTYRQDRVYVVFAFLTILDLVQQQLVRVVIGEGYNNFWLLLAPPAPPTQQTLQLPA